MTLSAVIYLTPGFSAFRCHWHLTRCFQFRPLDTSQGELYDKLNQEQENNLKRDQEQAVLEKPNKK